MNSVHNPQLEARGELRHLKIYYPSGDVQDFEGVFRGPVFMETGEAYVAVSVPQNQAHRDHTQQFNEIVGLDPLCVVVDERGGAVLYEPRSVSPEHFAPPVSKYLEENPAWPSMLEMSAPKDDRNGLRFLLGESPK